MANWIYITATNSGAPVNGLTLVMDIFDLDAGTGYTLPLIGVGDGIYKGDLSTIADHRLTSNCVGWCDTGVGGATERYKYWSNTVTKVVKASSY